MTSERKDRKMHRKTADRHLEEVKKRIQEVNENPTYCYRVTEAIVFGSYVNDPDREMLSDLDIALKLVPKYPTDSMEFYKKQSESKGKNLTEVLFWPYEEVLRFIRHRCSYVSIHKLGDPEQDKIILSGKTMPLKIEAET